MAYQIQNYLGEVVIDSVTEDQLAELINGGEHNYFTYDPNPEYDLVSRWKVALEEENAQDVLQYRIFKFIEE